MSTPRTLLLPFALAFVSPLQAQDWIDAPRVILPPGEGDIRKVGDLDGDGDADLLVVRSDGDGGAVSLHPMLRGPAGFVPGPSILLAQDQNPGDFVLELGDVTRDGRPDLVMDMRDYDTETFGLLVFPNLGGTFGAPVVVGMDGVPFGAAFGDADGDGFHELALCLYYFPTSSSVLGWWRWNGTTLAPRPQISVEITAGVGAADLDGDGRSEILIARDPYDLFEVFTTLPGGQPALTTTLDLGEHLGWNALHVGDLDGDGDPDALVRVWGHVADELALRVVENVEGELVLGDRSSMILPLETLGNERGTLADWDLDGDLDFFLLSHSLFIAENRGGVFGIGDFLRVTPYGSSWQALPRGGGVGDLTGDGLPDFAGGRFVYAGDGEIDGVGPLPGHLSELGVQDFDRDGDLDFVNHFLGNVLENDARGRFTSRPVALPTPPSGHSYSGDCPPVDLDGDGLGDLLRVLHRNEYPFNPVVATHLLRGTPLGTFANALVASPPGQAIRPPVFENLAADLDGDGDADVLVDDGYWENGGGGVLTAFHAGWSGRPMLTRDVDGDGDLDVLAQTSTGVLTLARDVGAGYASEPLATSSAFGMPSLGDLDGDGDLDLAVGTNTGGFAVLLLENVAGSFAAPLRLDLSKESHHRIAFDDFDGDGRVDVLSMPAQFEAIEWTLWPQSSTPWTFEPPLEFLGGRNLKIADFDSDGDLDGLGWRLTRSRRFEGAAAGRIRQEGAGYPATEPVAPLLGARGSLRPGSTGAELVLQRARGGATGLLLLSSRALVNGPDGKARRLPPYGATLAFVLSGTPGASGEGSFRLPLGPATIALAGQRVWLQALVQDSAAPPSQVAISNALELTFGL